MLKPHTNAFTASSATAQRRGWCVQAAIVAVGLWLLAFAPTASAFKVLSTAGSGAGQTANPQGLAVDLAGAGAADDRLYVGDAQNDRVDVFDSTGAFVEAFGETGTGPGQFNSPMGIAVDPSSQAVYVVDYDNRRIQKFDKDGNFLLTFGGEVNKTTGGDLCTAASGDICGAGDPGPGGAVPPPLPPPEPGDFSSTSTSRIFVGVGPGGTIYVVDSFNPGGAKFRYRLQKFDSSGVLLPPEVILFEGGRASAFAIDSSSGDFYVGNEDSEQAIRKYDSSGSLLATFNEKAASALAVNPVDQHLFAASQHEVNGGLLVRSSISERDPSGTMKRRFGYGVTNASVSALAPYQSATGDIYMAEGGNASQDSRVLHLDFPQPGPIVLPLPCSASPIGNTKATLNAEVNPEGKATTIHFEYIAEADFVANGNSFSGPNPPSTTAESASIGSDFSLHKVSGVADDVVPSTEYRCRVVAKNEDNAAGVLGPEGAFTTLPPLEFGPIWATAVGTEEATLNATVNPLGIPTTGHFEYVDEATYQKDIAELGPDHGFEHASRAPVGEEIDFGAGEDLKEGAATIVGLSPGTTYRYRIVATDPLIAPKEVAGPTKVLRTYLPGATPPDDRAYEMVSPAQKNSAEVAIPGRAGGLSREDYVRTWAAAGSGEAVTYTSWNSFGDPDGAPATSQYLSKRTVLGWETENLSPAGFLKNPVKPPYRGFTPDLSFGAFVMDEPALTEDAVEGFQNLYLRNNQTGDLRALTTEAPEFVRIEDRTFGSFCTAFAGATEDGSRAFFAANGAFAGAPEGIGFSLYEWSAEDGLALVSVLPGEVPAAPKEKTAYGAQGGDCRSGDKRPAISEDGSIAFWTYVPSSGPTKLLARIDGAETIQLDLKAGGVGQSGNGVFRAASAEGSKAFFTATSKLTPGASASAGAPDLYRYDLEARALTNLTPGSEPSDVLGVVGTSDDGSYVYFVARGALAPGAVAGKTNLYLFHEGGGTRFIGALSPEDEPVWDVARFQAARVASDGRHLAFLSRETEGLVGYDNEILGAPGCVLRNETELVGDPHCSEAFVYDAEADELSCASCNPSGARPTGPTLLPTWSNPFEGPRYLSDNGSRLFFESFSALLPADENEKRDVYEFERPGEGTCATDSTSFNQASGGCLYLISSGRSTDHSYLLDASAEGRDVFFSTRQRFVGWDQDDNYDVYDYRVGGGFPEPPTLSTCLGEACKPSATPPPSAPPSPATASFQGPGNQADGRPRSCPKGKVRRRGRCVKPSRRKGQKRKQDRRRAHDPRRAQR